MNAAATTTLTPDQRRFAEQHGATLGLSLDSGILMYLETPRSTLRWLVNRDGRALESVEFRRAA